jgi:DNA-binding LytR/AlgR family response regulator
MKVTIENVPEGVENEVIIRCHTVDESIHDLMAFLETPKHKLLGFIDKRLHLLEPQTIFYIESFDNKVFIHDEKLEYESLKKLYELEQDLESCNFLRTSKSTILNIDKIESVRPYFDGRLEALLKNGAKTAISRNYVSALKRKLGI